VRHHLQRYQAVHGVQDSEARIAALLAGEPFPSKGNLGNRFLKQADRAAGYVPLANPLATVSRCPA
jgi:hypothetical protein